MATATKKSRSAKQPENGAATARDPASMEFRIFQDNGGSYRWTIVAGDGIILARSRGFGSHNDAEQAAQRVQAGAASARFERRAGE